MNEIGCDGRVSTDPLQVIPVGRNAHCIRADGSNQFVHVTALGIDAVFQFTFDVVTGELRSNTPPLCLTVAMTGPRHFVSSADNRFLFLLNEMTGTITTFALDAKSGLLSEVSSVSGLPPDTTLKPGAPRGGPPGPPGTKLRDTDNDIWCADIHVTPHGKFLYISERTDSTLGAFSVDARTGKLTYVSSTTTERQPRGFAIDPNSRFLVATGEKSDTISVYAIDQTSGTLKFLNKHPTGKGSNWVEIVSFD